MATVLSDRVYTPGDLLTLPDGDRFELVDGQLMESEMSAKSSHLALRLGARLLAFVEDRRCGLVLDSSASYQCFPGDPNRVRKPDVSFVERQRWQGAYETGHIPIAPDLAVEVVSPNEFYYDVQRKVDEYLRSGVRLIWIINPDLAAAHVYRADGTVAALHSSDELLGENVVPGFRCPLADLFAALTPPT